MTAKNGNSYTTGTTTNSVEITTASQVGFLTTVSSNKLKCPQVIATTTDNRK